MMRKQTVRWAIFSSLISHGVGLFLLLLFTALGLKAEDPSAVAEPMAYSCLLAGAILCGILLRRQGDPASSVGGGLIYGLLPTAVSLFGDGVMGFGVRLLVSLGLSLAAVAVALFFPKRRRKQRKRGYYRP